MLAEEPSARPPHVEDASAPALAEGAEDVPAAQDYGGGEDGELLEGLDDLIAMSQEEAPADAAAETAIESGAMAAEAAALGLCEGPLPPSASSTVVALLPSVADSLVPFGTCLGDLVVQPSEAASEAQVEELMACNMCEERQPKSCGVRKGAKWWRCRGCISAVQRLEYACKSDLAKQNLAKLKRDHKRFRDEVMKERANDDRGVKAVSRLGCYMEELVVENSIEIADRALAYNELQWTRQRMSEGLSKEEASAHWQEACASGLYHKVTRHGKECLVDDAPTEITNRRVQKWKRSVRSESKEFKGNDAMNKAFGLARQLSGVDIVSEPAFASAGARLLRPPGALPTGAVSGDEDRCPLSTRARAGTDEPSLSQELAKSASGASASGSPAPKRIRSDILLERQSRLTAVREAGRGWKKALKRVKDVAEHKNWGALSLTDQDTLDPESMRCKLDALALECAKLEEELPAATEDSLPVKLRKADEVIGRGKELSNEFSVWDQAAKDVFKELHSRMRRESFATRRFDQEQRKRLTDGFGSLPSMVQEFLYLARRDDAPQMVAFADPKAAPSHMDTIVVWKASTAAGKTWAAQIGQRAAAGTAALQKKLGDGCFPEQRIGSLMRFQWSSPVPEKGPPAWWAAAQQALGLPASLATAAPPELSHPWLLCLRKASCLGGAPHIPLMGLCGLLSVMHGSVFVIFMTAGSIDHKEGAAYQAIFDPAAVVKERFSAKEPEWRHTVLSQGDVVLVPAGVSCLLVGLEDPPDTAAKATIAVWWPLPRLQDHALPLSQNPAWSHACAGAAANRAPAWRAFSTLQEVASELYPAAESQASHGSAAANHSG